MKSKLVTIFFILTSFSIQAQVELSMKLQKGETYCITTSNKITIIQTINGLEEKTINTEKGSF